MTHVLSRRSFLFTLLSVAVFVVSLGTTARAEPLKIAYSDWPGWVAWDVAIQKGFFKEAGVDVEFVWFEYVPSMEAFAAGKVDACSMTNGDAMVTGSTGKPSTAIVINDYSDGNDQVVAKQGIASFKDLKGKKIGVELNFVDHLLLLKALESNGMTEADVTLVNIPTNETPQALAAGGVDAIAAWYPSSGQALKQVAGSTTVYSSKDVPGLIYDALFVSKESLQAHKDDWKKVAAVWFKTVDYIKDPKNKEEVMKIMSARVNVTPEEYAKIAAGTHLLDLAGNTKAFAAGDGLDSIIGSSKIVDTFNTKHGVYKDAVDVGSYFDASIVKEIAEKK